MTTTLRKMAPFAAILAAASLAFTACSSADEETTDSGAATVTVLSNDGEAEVPTNPERVAVLDNTAAETIKALGVTPVAVPKGLLDKDHFADWIDNASIADVGNHREPNLDALEDADPDVIFGGYRFGDFADDLKKIALTVDLAGDEEYEGGWTASLVHQTEELGKIFTQADAAKGIIDTFTEAEGGAKAATTGQSVFLAVASGGKIDNGASRIGRIIEPLNLKDVFEGEAGDVHGDSGLAPETIAQANPDWVIVLDRDAAVSSTADTSTPAAQLIAAQEAFRNTTFFKEEHIIYLDPNFYLREGIQSYTEAYRLITEKFTAAA